MTIDPKDLGPVWDEHQAAALLDDEDAEAEDLAMVLQVASVEIHRRGDRIDVLEKAASDTAVLRDLDARRIAELEAENADFRAAVSTPADDDAISFEDHVVCCDANRVAALAVERERIRLAVEALSGAMLRGAFYVELSRVLDAIRGHQ